ncbi:MAG: hypothetical protein F4Y69_11210 [Chloroflexi bacterium]|nr:hypothetical protein [Chloroflexota bacterium]MYB22709.1 hypothetical protein [Chloroflexota bacterium]MYI03824.1 hypothetical protein [Chloroflexota bacterium]
MIIDILRLGDEGGLVHGRVGGSGWCQAARSSEPRSQPRPLELEAEVEQTLSDTERVEAEEQQWDGA